MAGSNHVRCRAVQCLVTGRGGIDGRRSLGRAFRRTPSRSAVIPVKVWGSSIRAGTNAGWWPAGSPNPDAGLGARRGPSWRDRRHLLVSLRCWSRPSGTANIRPSRPLASNRPSSRRCAPSRFRQVQRPCGLLLGAVPELVLVAVLLLRLSTVQVSRHAWSAQSKRAQVESTAVVHVGRGVSVAS